MTILPQQWRPLYGMGNIRYDLPMHISVDIGDRATECVYQFLLLIELIRQSGLPRVKLLEGSARTFQLTKRAFPHFDVSLGGRIRADCYSEMDSNREISDALLAHYDVINLSTTVDLHESLLARAARFNTLLVMYLPIMNVVDRWEVSLEFAASQDISYGLYVRDFFGHRKACYNDVYNNRIVREVGHNLFDIPLCM